MVSIDWPGDGPAASVVVVRGRTADAGADGGYVARARYARCTAAKVNGRRTVAGDGGGRRGQRRQDGAGTVRRDCTRGLVLHGDVTHGFVRWGFHVRARYFRLLTRRSYLQVPVRSVLAVRQRDMVRAVGEAGGDGMAAAAAATADAAAVRARIAVVGLVVDAVAATAAATELLIVVLVRRNEQVGLIMVAPEVAAGASVQ